MGLEKQDYAKAFSDWWESINKWFGEIPDIQKRIIWRDELLRVMDDSWKALLDILDTPNKSTDLISVFDLPYKVQQETNIPNLNEIQRSWSSHKNRLLLPKDMLNSWNLLHWEFKQNTNVDLVLNSAYRSPFFQFWILAYNFWVRKSKRGLSDIEALEDVFKTVAPLFCSRHWNIPPAIDIGNFMLRSKGNPQGMDVERLEDIYDIPLFKDFLILAEKYGFVLSYPPTSQIKNWQTLINDWVWEPWEFLYSESN